MLFTSWQFILAFLPATWAGFFLIPASQRTARKLWLTGASIVFYAYWKIEYVPLLLLSLGTNYLTAELLCRYRDPRHSRWLLGAGVAFNLLLLGYYKYTNFILSALGLATGEDFGRFDIILPLAISFFTFTQIAYLVDVWRDQTLHYGFVDFALFVVFFPHLIAGPIVRHWEVIPQYARRDLKPDQTDVSVGVALFVAGLCKKVLLADPAAVLANAVYGAAQAGAAVPWFDAWMGTLAFAMQIYFDFSGYSDMAIGLARLFGIRFPCNFDSPYQAGNIAEFWRRWHMTLTRFLRDYVYFPLGGSRCGRWRHAGNLMATFGLSGLWHGAGWTFLAWGALHGCYLTVRQQWEFVKKRIPGPWDHWSYRVGSVGLTFVAVLISWVYFRAPDLATAHHLLGSMFAAHGLTISSEWLDPLKPTGRMLSSLGLTIVPPTFAVKSAGYTLQLLAVLLAIAWISPNTQQLLRDYDPIWQAETVRPARWRWRLNARLGLTFGVLAFFVVHSKYAAVPSPFLYFNF